MEAAPRSLSTLWISSCPSGFNTSSRRPCLNKKGRYILGILNRSKLSYHLKVKMLFEMEMEKEELKALSKHPHLKAVTID
jgi:hypothetical protein